MINNHPREKVRDKKRRTIAAVEVLILWPPKSINQSSEYLPLVRYSSSCKTNEGQDQYNTEYCGKVSESLAAQTLVVAEGVASLLNSSLLPFPITYLVSQMN